MVATGKGVRLLHFGIGSAFVFYLRGYYSKKLIFTSKTPVTSRARTSAI